MKLQDCIQYPNTQCPDGCCFEPEEKDCVMAAPEHIRDEQIEKLGLRIVDEVKSTIVRPGDTLIVSFAKRITDYEYHTLRDFLVERAPGVNVLVLPEVADVRTFRPTEPEDM